MAYFPFFIDLDGKKGLIAGGGSVALRKVEKLLPYGPTLTVVAPVICPELACISGVNFKLRPFSPTDLDGASFVIAATDDPVLNRSIAQLCQQSGIPVNAVDDKDACTFLFPALVQQGSLCVGISTGGTSPSAAIWLKNQIDALLPANLDCILMWLEEQRPRVKNILPDEAARSQLFTTLFSACLKKGDTLSEDEFQTILKQEERNL